MFSLRSVLKSLALLVSLFQSSSVVFAQQQQEDDDSATLMTSDDNNTDLSLLLTNYNALREEGQGFYIHTSSVLYEKPNRVMTSSVGLHWWCDLKFSSDDATNNYGYVGREVQYFLGSSLEDVVAQGARSLSAVLVPSLGIFEGQRHATNDDLVFRYWDDGSLTLPLIGWEGHDEGDTSQDADTSAWSGSGTLTKITTEEAAELLGMDVGDMTPETCSTEYEAVWNANHVPDPIDTSVTTLEENVAQLQADNKELLSRIAAIEGSLTANGSGSGDDGKATETSSLSPVTAWYKHDTTDIVVKSIMTVAIIIGLVAFDFI